MFIHTAPRTFVQVPGGWGRLGSRADGNAIAEAVAKPMSGSARSSLFDLERLAIDALHADRQVP